MTQVIMEKSKAVVANGSAPRIVADVVLRAAKAEKQTVVEIYHPPWSIQ